MQQESETYDLVNYKYNQASKLYVNLVEEINWLELEIRRLLYYQKKLDNYESFFLKYGFIESKTPKNDFFARSFKFKGFGTLPNIILSDHSKTFRSVYRKYNTLPKFEYFDRFVNLKRNLTFYPESASRTIFEKKYLIDPLAIGKVDNGNYVRKNSIFKKYFRFGGKWHHKRALYKTYPKTKMGRDFLYKGLDVSRRMRSLSENNYLDVGIENRNYLKTDSTSYRTKYLVDSPNYRKGKLGMYLKKNKFLNMHKESFDYEFIYKTIPYFFKGRWSGSDSGQTVIDYKKNKIAESNQDYKTFNPLFGIYVLNLQRLGRDLLKNN